MSRNHEKHLSPLPSQTSKKVNQPYTLTSNSFGKNGLIAGTFPLVIEQIECTLVTMKFLLTALIENLLYSIPILLVKWINRKLIVIKECIPIFV